MSRQRFLICFVAVAVLPVLAAWLVLQAGWYSSGVNNKGQWLDRELQLLPAANRTAPHWRLVYLQPASCDSHCQAVQQLMLHIDTALGRKSDQLELVVLTEQPAAGSVGTSRLNYQQGSFAGLTAGGLLLVEMHGLALLRYTMPTDPQQLPLAGKDVMADLQKLMKFDRGPA